MATTKRPKSQSVTNEQKQAMVDYLSSHPELSRGIFTNNFTHSTAFKQWMELGETLNTMIGPSKEWKAGRRHISIVSKMSLSCSTLQYLFIDKIAPQTITMGDKPPPKNTHTYLKRSSSNTVSKTATNKHSTNSPKTNNTPKMIPNQQPATTNNTNLINEKPTQKTFAETTANQSFPKKNQAIIFNTIDGIPQIEYIKAISLITNPSNIKFASRISNNRFCVYFANSNIVNDIINRYPTITVDNNNIEIRRLENQAKRIIISNVPPIIPHIYITDALNLIGINTLTPISFLKAGFSTEDLSHIISFRRQTHIKFEDTAKLPGSLVIHFEDTDYRIFLTDDTLTCYLCKRTGHTSAHCKNTPEHSKYLPPSQTILPSSHSSDDTQKINIINTNDSSTLYTEDNQNIYLEQTQKLEKPNLTSHINEPQQNNTKITDPSQEHFPPNTLPTVQIKRPISDTSSQKSSFITSAPSSPSHPDKTKISKKPKIRSRSNSSTRSIENRDDAFKPIEKFFDDNKNSPINFLQFKYILEQSTNKHINIHSLCEQANIDIISLMNLYFLLKTPELPTKTKTKPSILNTNMDQIIQWNINGLFKHLTDIQRAKYNIKPIVFCFQETNLKPYQKFPIRGYEGYLKNRPNAARASGGVATYVTNLIKSKEIQIQSNLEVVTVILQLKNPLCICNIYIPDSTNLSLQDLNQIIQQLPKPFILLGDFNSRNQMWGSNHTDLRGKTMETFLDNDQLILLNTGEYTRHDSTNNSFSAIDLTISNSTLAPQLEWKVLNEYNCSDHWPISITLLEQSLKPPSHTHWNLKTPNWELYQDLINQNILENPIIIDTETQQTQTQINSIITQFTNIILNAANITIGKTNTSHKRKTVPWWNDECKHAIKKYKKCLNKFKKTRSLSDHINLKESRAASRYIIKKYKTESWQQYTNSINPNSCSTEIWKKIKAIKGITHQPLPSFLKYNDILLSSPIDISNAFAQSFTKNSCDSNFDPVFAQYKHNIENTITYELNYNFQHQDNHLNIPFSENELLNTMSNCKSKSPGPDNIPYSFIQNLPSNAYDMTWRNRILKIIQNANINGKMFLFLKNFLSNRTIQVRAFNEVSNIYTTENGIPQGSVISVTMFLIAINDIFHKIPNPTKHIIFADDCYIYCNDTTIKILQSSLNTLQNWSNETGFKFSPTKSQYIVFNHKPEINQNLYLNN
ncbi:Uncharacterized protein FWK35_00023634, partial [Aphis craccivora]